MKIAVLVVLIAWPAAAQQAQQGSSTQVLNLSVVEALGAVGHADLAGLFAFIPEKDNAAAFADFLLRNEAAKKKYMAKVEKDYKLAGGLTDWDHAVLQDIVAVYGSPMGELVKKPSPKVILHMAGLASSPTVSLEELAQKRRK